MELIYIDMVTVIIAAVVYLIAGAIWYSPLLFGNAVGKKALSLQKNKWLCYLGQLIVAIIISFFLALLLAFIGATSTMDGIYVGIGVWFGFVATTKFSGVIWRKKGFKLFCIHAGFELVGFCILGAIIGA